MEKFHSYNLVAMEEEFFPILCLINPKPRSISFAIVPLGIGYLRYNPQSFDGSSSVPYSTNFIVPKVISEVWTSRYALCL